jgi:glycosyltransferase involved in cell wall biosynthesis
MQGPKLVVVGQTPPPFNGQAKMIGVMLQGLASRYDIRFIRMEFSASVSTAGKFSFGKIFQLFGLILKTLKALGVDRKRYLYYPPASPNLVPVLRDIVFLLAVRPFCKGLILHFHAGGVSRYAAKHPVLRFFLGAVYGRMSLGIVQGDSCPDDPHYFKAKLTAVVPYGIAVDVRSGDDSRTDGSCLRILYVGIHTEGKGLFTLLETAKELSHRGVDFTIHTVGQWYAQTEERRFFKYLEDLGLQEKIICVGQKTGEDLWREYAWGDVFLFPTQYPWETMGIVQLEAMAYGIPVVASDWQGPKDVVVDGETGFLCCVNKPAEFADRLQWLANDAELRHRLGKTGRERYETFYTVGSFIERMTEALGRLP